MPPMRPARGTKNEFIAIVEDDEGVGGMCGGYKNDTHGCRRLFIVSLRIVKLNNILKSISFRCFRNGAGGGRSKP